MHHFCLNFVQRKKKYYNVKCSILLVIDFFAICLPLFDS